MNSTGTKHLEPIEMMEDPEGVEITIVNESASPKELITHAKETRALAEESMEIVEDPEDIMVTSVNELASPQESVTRANETNIKEETDGPLLDTKCPDDAKEVTEKEEPIPTTFDCFFKQVFSLVEPPSEIITKQINEPEFLQPHSMVPSRECEYDALPTELYQALEARQFGYALSLLKDSSPEQMEDPKMLCGFEQANTWIYRKNEDNDQIRWRMLPLHAAVIFGAPFEVVDSIIDLSPNSVKLTDDTGKLPIHLAFSKNADKKIIHKLLTAHPESVQMKDGKGRLPHECAGKEEMELLSTYTELMVQIEQQQIIKEFNERQDKEVAELKKKLDEQVSEVKISYDAKIAALKQINDEQVSELKVSYDKKIAELKEINEVTERESLKCKISSEQQLAKLNKVNDNIKIEYLEAEKKYEKKITELKTINDCLEEESIESKRSYYKKIAHFKKINDNLEEEYLASKRANLQKIAVFHAELERINDNLAKEYLESRDESFSLRENFVTNMQTKTSSGQGEENEEEEEVYNLKDDQKLFRNHLVQSRNTIKAQSIKALQEMDTRKQDKILSTDLVMHEVKNVLKD